MQEAKFFSKLPGGRIQCNLCPRLCQLKENQHGFCFVRQNMGGKINTLAYGKPYAVNVDPIEKKPLFHFLPGTRILSLGTVGCNMACKFCQNWDISKAKVDQSRAIDLSPTRVVQMALHYKASGIAYTYNEPTIFAEYAMACAEIAVQHNLKNVMVSNGYISPEVIPEVYKHMSAANIDLKAFTEEFYNHYTLSHLQPVLTALKKLVSLGVWLEITNLIIPTLNDNLKEIQDMCSWIYRELGPDTPLHLTAFHPDYQLTSLPPTTPSVLLNAREIAKNTGLRYVYVGNISDEVASSTYCTECGTMLIRRNWYNTEIVGLEEGICRKCGQRLPGILN